MPVASAGSWTIWVNDRLDFASRGGCHEASACCRHCACVRRAGSGAAAVRSGAAVPESAPELDYVVAPTPVTLPAGMTMGAAASVAFDANGHLFVLTRGDKTFFEFDRDGTFIRAFGDKAVYPLAWLAHRPEGNLWATDVGSHVVVKMNRDGQALLTIGTRGEAGEWNEASGSRKLNQPNDVVIADSGDIFVVQGHTPGPSGDARASSSARMARSSNRGAVKELVRVSSRSRTASISTPRVCCGLRIGRINVSRSSSRTERSSGKSNTRGCRAASTSAGSTSTW